MPARGQRGAGHHDKASFRVGGKIFGDMPPDGEHLHVMVDEAEVAAAVDEDPVACQELRWAQRLAGVRIFSSAADPDASASSAPGGMASQGAEGRPGRARRGRP